MDVEELVKKYIAMPMAVAVFKQDQDKFLKFQLGNLYLDMIDSIIKRMNHDYFIIKKELLSVHHMEVKKLETGKYAINKEVVVFSPEELKEMTRQLMSDYLYGDNAAEFERTDRGFTS